MNLKDRFEDIARKRDALSEAPVNPTDVVIERVLSAN